jgi:beta-glucosidase
VPLAQTFIQSPDRQADQEFLSGGDRSSLTLHPHDEALIQEISAVNPQTIVAIMGGSAVIMENWRHLVPAILMLWYPGMEGGHALADVLLGRVNPAGKLPFAIPRRAEHLPFFDRSATGIEYDLWHGYRKLARDGHIPAFPFGFGLSYTNFRYANLVLAQQQLGPDDSLHISFDLTNMGNRTGDEIVQLYISALDSQVERAPKELKAFTRLTLQPGKKSTVHLDLPMVLLAYYDESLADFVVEPTDYQVFIGAHSLDPHALTGRFVVHGDSSP